MTSGQSLTSHLVFCLAQRLIEKAPFGDDGDAIEQQIVKHGKYHSSLQQSIEVDRARNELVSPVS